jgi:hypothetical protein
MRSAANNILAGEQPVAPAEAANMIQSPEEEDCCLGVLDGVLLHADFLGLFANVREEFAVGVGAVGAEFVEDLGEGGRRHGDLAEMVEEGDLCGKSG